MPEQDGYGAGVALAAPQPGELIVARNRKFDGRAHWVVPGIYLGADELGHWIFQGAGEFISRPGAALHAESDATFLIPHDGDWVATFYDAAHPHGVELYIDVACDFSWRRIRPHVVEFHLIDMDLDVVRTKTAGVFVDDEDEFAAHRVLLQYPTALCDRMEAATAALVEAVTARQGPFDGREAAWFTRGRSLL